MSATETASQLTAFNFKDSELKKIPLEAIRENSESLRPVVDKTSVEYVQLLDSVKRHGILTPILVRPQFDPADGSQLYGMIDGLHRYNAAMDAGLTEIPAQVGDLNEANLLEAQIIANVHKIETTPTQYTKALLKILAGNPLMTVSELCQQINKETEWFYKRLGLLKLSKPIQEMVDNGTINLSNAYILAQLPEDKQEDFVQAAISKTSVDFGGQVKAVMTEIKKAKAEGRKADIDKFTPVAVLRRLPEVRDERDLITTKPEVSQVSTAAQRAGVKTVNEALAFALNWVINMDPDSVATQEQKWTADRKQKEEKAAAAKAEREKAKQAKAVTGVAP